MTFLPFQKVHRLAMSTDYIKCSLLVVLTVCGLNPTQQRTDVSPTTKSLRRRPLWTMMTTHTGCTKSSTLQMDIYLTQ